MMRAIKLVTFDMLIILAMTAAGVHSESPVIDVTTTATSSIVSADQLAQLPSGTRDLRFVLDQVPGIDQATFDTGKKHVAGSEVRIRPDNWTCTPNGGSWDCSGPTIPAANNAYFAFVSPSDVKIPNAVDLELRYAGRRIWNQKISVGYSTPGAASGDLEEILDTPGGVRPGNPFLVSPSSELYRGGSWGCSVDGRDVERLDPSTLDLRYAIAGLALRDHWFFTLPTTTTADSDLRFTYRNPFGDLLVDAAPPDWFLGPQDAPPCSPAGLSMCQERVALESSICVCGCFPDPFAVDLRLDGKPIPFPSAFSSGMVRFTLPEVTPGTHTISWPGIGQAMDFEAVNLTGAIAQDKLNVGQSTELGFELQGSDAMLPLEIELESGGIKIQGGNKQIAHFNGGAANIISRKVLAVAVGVFTIEYTLQLSPCPCGGYEGRQLVDDELATHPMSASGSADTTLVGSGVRYPLTFSSDSIVAFTPKPPFETGIPLELRFGQLGLRASIAGYDDFLFEQRADQRSIASLRNTRLGSGGGFASGDADLTLHTEFSTPFRDDLPFKIGASYDLSIDSFELGGSSQGLGDVRFEQPAGTSSSARFYDIQKDAAGTTLFGYADFTLGGRLRIGADWASTASPSAPVPGSTTLDKALSQGLIDVRYSGNGVSTGEIFTLDVTRNVADAFTLQVPTGTVFECDDPGYSTMISGDPIETELTSPTTSVAVTGYSLDRGLSPPPGSATRDPGWTVKDPSENPRYQTAKTVITTGGSLSGGGGYSSGPEYLDTVIQGSIWHAEDPQGYTREDLEQDLTSEFEDEDEAPGKDELEQLTDEIWSDIDLTVKQSRGES